MCGALVALTVMVMAASWLKLDVLAFANAMPAGAPCGIAEKPYGFADSGDAKCATEWEIFADCL
jgi:hypothetical protein